MIFSGVDMLKLGAEKGEIKGWASGIRVWEGMGTRGWVSRGPALLGGTVGIKGAERAQC